MSLIGKVLGKYRIVDKIGSGGIADVYKGIQIGLDREVAIKVLPPAFSQDREMVKRFRRESQATAKLSHPNIITIYDSGEQEGVYFYVMEFLKTDSLEDLLEREKPFALIRAIKIGQDVLKALVYCHEKEILHRDLKPAKIKFDMRENAILTDFAQAEGEEPSSDPRVDLVQVGHILGTMLEGVEMPDDMRQLVDRARKADPAVAFATAKEMLGDLKKVELKLKAKKLTRQTAQIPRSQASGAVSAVSAVSQAVSGQASASVSSSRTSLSALLAVPKDGEALAKLLAITVPVFLLGLAGVLYSFGIIFPRPEAALLEKTMDVDATRATISWKTTLPCYSHVEYWPSNSTQAKVRSKRSPVAQIEHRHVLSELRPDTMYNFRFLFNRAAEEDGRTVAGEMFDFTTRPEITVFNIHVDEYATRAVVTWETNLRTDTAVKYGKTEEYEDHRNNPEQKSESIHSITLDGLTTDSTYHYRIVAADPRSRGLPKTTEDLQFRTSRDDVDPKKGEEAGMVNLTRSYVDKLTRMTPDERQKLKDSIGKFTDLKAPLTAAEKKTLREKPTNPTADDEFSTRLQMTRRWIADLALAGKSASRWSVKPVPLETLHHINRLKAAHKLDQLVKELGAAEQ